MRWFIRGLSDAEKRTGWSRAPKRAEKKRRRRHSTSRQPYDGAQVRHQPPWTDWSARRVVVTGSSSASPAATGSNVTTGTASPKVSLTGKNRRDREAFITDSIKKGHPSFKRCPFHCKFVRDRFACTGSHAVDLDAAHVRHPQKQVRGWPYPSRPCARCLSMAVPPPRHCGVTPGRAGCRCSCRCPEYIRE